MRRFSIGRISLLKELLLTMFSSSILGQGAPRKKRERMIKALGLVKTQGVLGIVFLEGGNELCISSYSIGLTYALPYIGLLEHPP